MPTSFIEADQFLMEFDPIVSVPNLPAILSDAALPKPQSAGAVVWEVDQRSIQSRQWHRPQRPLDHKRGNEGDDECLRLYIHSYYDTEKSTNLRHSNPF